MTKDKKAALTTVAVGFGFSTAAFVTNAILAPGPRLAQMLSLAITLGAVIFVLGCVQLARAKGRPWYFGLLGLFSCVGLAVLWWLVPDRRG